MTGTENPLVLLLLFVLNESLSVHLYINDCLNRTWIEKSRSIKGLRFAARAKIELKSVAETKFDENTWKILKLLSTS